MLCGTAQLSNLTQLNRLKLLRLLLWLLLLVVVVVVVAVVVVVVVVVVALRLSNMLVYLRDGSAQTKFTCYHTEIRCRGLWIEVVPLVAGFCTLLGRVDGHHWSSSPKSLTCWLQAPHSGTSPQQAC